MQATAQSGLLALAGRESALDDAVAVLMRFAAGGIGAIHVAWSGVGLATYSLDVHAADVSLQCALEPMRELRGHANGTDVAITSVARPRGTSLARFFASARAADPASVACSPADALDTLRAVLACERALASGERVAV